MPADTTSSKISSKPPRKKVKKTTSVKSATLPLSQEFITSSDQEGESDTPVEQQQNVYQSHQTPTRSVTSPVVERRKSSYEQPPGFRLMTGTSGVNAFSAENLENKSLFVFTAPSNAKISDIITQLPLQPGPDGADLPNAGGRSQYTVRKDEDDSPSLNILFPSADGEGYSRARHKISAHFTISETPPLDKISRNIVDKQPGTIVRPQPPGLKMRFKPSGWGNDEVSEEDGYGLDDEPDAPDVQVNGSHESEAPSSRREDADITSSHKHKSHKHHHHKHSRKHDKSLADEDKPSDETTKRKKTKTKRHEGETPEERKARKEQKRLKKEKA